MQGAIPMFFPGGSGGGRDPQTILKLICLGIASLYFTKKIRH